MIDVQDVFDGMDEARKYADGPVSGNDTGERIRNALIGKAIFIGIAYGVSVAIDLMAPGVGTALRFPVTKF